MASARSSAATGRASAGSAGARGYGARDYRSAGARDYRSAGARDYRSAGARGSVAREYAAPTRPARRTRRRRQTPPPPWTRIRWDRVGRTGLVIVLAVVVGLYVQNAIEYVSTRVQAEHQRAGVERLARANAALRKRQQSLSSPVTITHDARILGMVQAGERPYVVIGLPKR